MPLLYKEAGAFFVPTKPVSGLQRISRPYALASVSVICSERRDVAEGLKQIGDLAMLRRQKGERGAPPTL
jgi:hypothetical protein